MRDIGKAFRRPHRDAHCRFACPTGTAVSANLVDWGFRTAHSFEMGRMAPDVPYRYATRSRPKAPVYKQWGDRLYGSLIRTFGITLSLAPCSSAGSCRAAMGADASGAIKVSPKTIRVCLLAV